MRNEFDLLQVAAVERTTADTVSISFNLNDNQAHFNQFEHGQYLTFELEVNGETLRRSYSVSSSHLLNEHLTIAVKEVAGGKVSTYLNREVKAGDTLKTLPAQGSFCISKLAEAPKSLVLIAGGSGITPILSLIKENAPHIPVHLIYGNRDEASIIYKKEIEELAALYTNFTVTHVLENGGNGAEKGMLDTKNFQRILSESPLNEAEATFFVCGPTPMMQAVQTGLQENGVDSKRIMVEYFVAPETTTKNKPETFGAVNENPKAKFKGKAKVSVTLDGQEHELVVNHKTSILSAMLAMGLDAPYSCQGGICSTCRAKVTHGEVKLKNNLGITDGEVAEGFTLTCSTYPLSDDIKINFDA